MGYIAASKSKADKLAVGGQVASLLPDHGKPWYKVRHLLALNAIIMVPFISQSAVGYDGSMMNGLQSLTQWRAYFGNPTAPILGTMNAMYPLGKFIAVFIAAFLGDRYGRKAPLYVGLVLLLLGSGIQGGAISIPMFIIGRLLLGFATAFVSQSAPILITELSYPSHRGIITSMYYSTYHIGAVIAAWTTYGTFRIPSDWSWRIPSILQGAIPLIQCFGIWFVPESPRWLIAKGRNEEARGFFKKYHAGGDDASPLVDFEMSEIEEIIRQEKLINSQTSYYDLVKNSVNRRRTLIAVIVGWWATWGGIGLISYYLALVLNTIGITGTDKQTLINALLSMYNWVLAVTAGAFIDRIGRRPLWLLSAGGMTICYVVWTVLSARFAATKDPAIGKGVLAFIFLYNGFYDIGFSPMIFAYPIEIYPYTLRARGLTISIATTEAGLIMGQFLNPIALKSIGWKYYILFCCLLATFFVLVWFLFPETKGRTLEEIAEIFDGDVANVTDAKMVENVENAEMARGIRGNKTTPSKGAEIERS